MHLLTGSESIAHIRIANVHGSYYQYCIGFTKYYPGETTGHFDAITLENICAVKAKRLPVQEAYMGNKNDSFPFLWIQDDTRVKTMIINGVHRREYVDPVESVHIGKDAVVEKTDGVNRLYFPQHVKKCLQKRQYPEGRCLFVIVYAVYIVPLPS